MSGFRWEWASGGAALVAENGRVLGEVKRAGFVSEMYHATSERTGMLGKFYGIEAAKKAVEENARGIYGEHHG